MTRRAHAWWALRPIVVVVAYLALRGYADRARSLEVVLGLSHGAAGLQALVAVSVVALRLAAWGVAGGTLVAWPLAAWLAGRAPAGPPVTPAAPGAHG